MAIATIYGGSHGLGLATAKRLYDDGFTVELVGRDFSLARKVFPNSLIRAGRIKFITHDLLVDDLQSLFLQVDQHPLIVFYVAGIGRLEAFSDTKVSYVRSCYAVNAEIPTIVFNKYYSNLCGRQEFYLGCVTSIAGQLASPLFSVYAASKAATSRLIESINVELAARGAVNRITDFCPGQFTGSSFSGGDTKLVKLMNLADELIESTLKKKWLFIPSYESVYKRVLERYQEDVQEFGRESYKFKAGRINHDV